MAGITAEEIRKRQAAETTLESIQRRSETKPPQTAKEIEDKTKLLVSADTSLGYGISDAERAKFQLMPPMGFWESAKRSSGYTAMKMMASEAGDLLSFGTQGDVKVDAEPHGFLYEGAVGEAMARIREGDYLGWQNKTYPKESYPMHTPETRAESAERQRVEDDKLVRGYLRAQAERNIRGTTPGFFGGNTGAGVAELPIFAIEFLASGGLATAGKEFAKKQLTKSLRKEMKSGLKSGLSKGAAATLETAVSATARLPVFSRRIGEGGEKNQNLAGMVLTEKGLELSKTISESPYKSYGKSIADTFIEVFSESSGQALLRPLFGATGRVAKAGLKKVPGAGFVKSKVPNWAPTGLFRSIEKVYAKLHPGEAAKGAASKLFTKLGFDGFIEELGEEQFGDLLRAVSGLEDFGAEDPSSVFDRLVNSIHGSEELMTNAGIMMFPTAANIGTQQAISRIQKRKNSDDFVKRQDSELTEEQIDQIFTKEAARKEADKPVAEKEGEAKAPVRERGGG
jgi:hypothetical protein